MELEQNEIKKKVMASAVLFLFVEGIFSLLNFISYNIFIIHTTDQKSINHILVPILNRIYSSLPKAIPILLIMLFLMINLKKLYNTTCFQLMNNKGIRITAGIMIAVNTALGFSILIPTYITSIISFNTTSMDPVIMNPLIFLYIGYSILYLSKLCIGLFLMKFYNRKTEWDHDVKESILSIGLLYIILLGIFRFLNSISINLSPNLDAFLSEFIISVLLTMTYMIVPMGIIIVYLMRSLKKNNDNEPIRLMSNNAVPKTVGAIIALEGIIQFSTNINNSIATFMSYSFSQFPLSVLIQNVIILLQIFVGIYLYKFYRYSYKEKNSTRQTIKKVLIIILLCSTVLAFILYKNKDNSVYYEKIHLGEYEDVQEVIEDIVVDGVYLYYSKQNDEDLFVIFDGNPELSSDITYFQNIEFKVKENTLIISYSEHSEDDTNLGSIISLTVYRVKNKHYKNIKLIKNGDEIPIEIVY